MWRFFLQLAIAMWDFIFSTQQRCGATGGMLEIGVFQWKSGILSAMHMPPNEPPFFLDLHEVPAARKHILSAKPQNVRFLKMNSINALRDPELAKARGALQWMHIDGEHTGYATRADLSTAAHLLSKNGVICVMTSLALDIRNLLQRYTSFYWIISFPSICSLFQQTNATYAVPAPYRCMTITIARMPLIICSLQRTTGSSHGRVIFMTLDASPSSLETRSVTSLGFTAI